MKIAIEVAPRKMAEDTLLPTKVTKGTIVGIVKMNPIFYFTDPATVAT